MAPRTVQPYESDAIRHFFDYSQNIARMLLVSFRGIRLLMDEGTKATTFSKLDDIIAEVMPRTKRRRRRKTEIRREKELAELGELAQKEIADGFPILMAQCVVGIWGALEVAIEDTLVSLLLHEPELTGREVFSKVKVPLTEFQRMDEEERARFLVSELDREFGAGRRLGVDGFERLLSAVGLAGTVSNEVKKEIREWHSLRNVIVHRASKADRRLTTDCPWLTLKAGERVVVSYEMLGKYKTAADTYLKTVLDRIAQRNA